MGVDTSLQYNGYNSYKFNQSDKLTCYPFGVQNMEYITHSFAAYSPIFLSEDTRAFTRFFGQDGALIKTENHGFEIFQGLFERVEITVAVPLNAVKAELTFVNNNANPWWVATPKTEEGQLATPYSVNTYGQMTYITPNGIYTGIITANQIVLASGGTLPDRLTLINANGVYTGEIKAEQIDTDTLSAISANLGHVTAGRIDGLLINGGEIIGTVIKTSEDGNRVEIRDNKITTYSGENLAVEMNRNQIRLYDWEGTQRIDPVGQFYTARRSYNENTPGVALGHNKDAYMALVYRDFDNYYPYISFDKDEILPNGLEGYPIKVDLQTAFSYGIGIGKQANHSIYQTIQGRFAINTAVSGFTIFAGGTSVINYDPSQSDPLYFRGNTLFSNNVHVNGGFTVSGSKNSLQKTENYGDRLINAYETAEYYFGDIGSGRINSDGECVVYIDEILQECINVNIQYHVFTQVYNGNITEIERHKNYFIVYGDVGTEFSWELKAKRKGYEHHRLEQPNKFNDGEFINLDEDLFEENEEDGRRDKILNQVLDYDITNILLEV